MPRPATESRPIRGRPPPAAVGRVGLALTPGLPRPACTEPRFASPAPPSPRSRHGGPHDRTPRPRVAPLRVPSRCLRARHLRGRGGDRHDRSMERAGEPQPAHLPDHVRHQHPGARVRAAHPPDGRPDLRARHGRVVDRERRRPDADLHAARGADLPRRRAGHGAGRGLHLHVDGRPRLRRRSLRRDQHPGRRRGVPRGDRRRGRGHRRRRRPHRLVHDQRALRPLPPGHRRRLHPARARLRRGAHRQLAGGREQPQPGRLRRLRVRRVPPRRVRVRLRLRGLLGRAPLPRSPDRALRRSEHPAGGPARGRTRRRAGADRRRDRA